MAKSHLSFKSASPETVAKYKGKSWIFTLPPEQARKLSEQRAKQNREAEKEADSDSNTE